MQVNSQTEKQVTKNATEYQTSVPRFLIACSVNIHFLNQHDGSTIDDNMATVMGRNWICNSEKQR